MLLYLHASGLRQTYWANGWQPKAAWRGMSQFVELGILGALQLCLKWWVFECLMLISGRLPDAVLAMGSNSISTSIVTMTYMPYLGASIAGNVRIGNALVAGLPKGAKLAAALSLDMPQFYRAFVLFPSSYFIRRCLCSSQMTRP